MAAASATDADAVWLSVSRGVSLGPAPRRCGVPYTCQPAVTAAAVAVWLPVSRGGSLDPAPRGCGVLYT
jgi:hypothetical protein